MKHYITLLPTQGNIPFMEEMLARMPTLSGFIHRFHWNLLEPDKDTYDFRGVAQALAFCDSKGVGLIPMVVDKTFTPENPAPPYAGALPNQTNGFSVARWNPEVSEGFLNLHKALTARFPHLLGIAIQETAPGFPSAQLDTLGYTPDKYVEHYKRLIKDIYVPIYFHYNFIPQGQDRITELLDTRTGTLVKLGGPDCWPANTALQVRTYPHYYKYYGPKFIVMSTPSYGQPGLSIEEVYNFAKDALEVKEVFWTYQTNVADSIASIVAKG